MWDRIEGVRLLAQVLGTVRPGRQRLPPSATGRIGDVPAAPWLLSGTGVLGFELVEEGSFAPPPGLEVVAVAPGRTLAMSFFCRYERSPVGAYHEGMRIAGMVRPTGGGDPGFLVTWIPVDSEASVQGGRALWGVPKTLARFEGEPRQGRVIEGEQALSWRVSAAPIGLPVTMGVPFLALREGALVFYRAIFAMKMAAALLHVEADPAHPGAVRGVPAGGCFMSEFDLLVGAACPVTLPS